MSLGFTSGYDRQVFESKTFKILNFHNYPIVALGTKFLKKIPTYGLCYTFHDTKVYNSLPTYDIHHVSHDIKVNIIFRTYGIRYLEHDTFLPQNHNRYLGLQTRECGSHVYHGLTLR